MSEAFRYLDRSDDETARRLLNRMLETDEAHEWTFSRRKRRRQQALVSEVQEDLEDGQLLSLEAGRNGDGT